MDFYFLADIALIALITGGMIANVFKSLEKISLRQETLLSILKNKKDNLVRDEIGTYLLILFMFGLKGHFEISWLLGIGIGCVVAFLFRSYQVYCTPALYCTFEKFEYKQMIGVETLNMLNISIKNNHKNTVIVSAIHIAAVPIKDKKTILKQISLIEPITLEPYSSYDITMKYELIREHMDEIVHQTRFEKFFTIFDTYKNKGDVIIEAVTQRGEVNIEPIFKPIVISTSFESQV